MFTGNPSASCLNEAFSRAARPGLKFACVQRIARAPENSGRPVGVGKVTRFGKRKIQPASFVNNAMTKRPARRPNPFGQACWKEKTTPFRSGFICRKGELSLRYPHFPPGDPLGTGKEGRQDVWGYDPLGECHWGAGDAVENVERNVRNSSGRGRPVGVGRNGYGPVWGCSPAEECCWAQGTVRYVERAAWNSSRRGRLGWGKGGKENAYPEFSGRQAGVLGKQKTGRDKMGKRGRRPPYFSAAP